MMKEFKEFISRGNVMDMAVGIIIGGAFTAIVGSLVADIITPIIGMLMGGVSFSELAVTVGSAQLTYGNFIQAI
ncbi:MAG: large conductance mechanosensitive channel protein MscL, partial [Firmicutes bacterium]|nr:large conductance mechanosensitive channel protein MscL [Bacillota bacterium]